MRKTRWVFLLAALFPALLTAQNVDNSQYVKDYLRQHPSWTIGQGVTAAQAACNADTSIPCIIVFDPSLAKYATGTMPAACSQCQWLDYRAGAPYIPSGGGHATGPFTAPQLSGVYTVDGITYASCNAAVAAALASSWAAVKVDCSMSGQHGSGGPSLAGFDPGSKSIELELGGFTYSVSGSITVRTGFHLEGNRGTSSDGCVLQSTFDGPMFKDPADGSVVYSPIIEGCTLLGKTGATSASIAVNYDQGASATTDVLDHPVLRDLVIGGFPGGDIRLASAASNTSAVIQFGLIDHVDAEPVVGRTLPIVAILGDVGNLTITDSVINQNASDTSSAADLDIGDNGGTQNAYSITVRKTTIQDGGLLVKLHGCTDCVFDTNHHEGIAGTTNGFQLAIGGSQNKHVTVTKSYFAGNIGTTATTGYLFNGTASGNALSINVENNAWSTPANVALADTSSHTQQWTFRNNYGESPFLGSGVSNFLQGNTATLVLNGMHQAFIDDTTTVTSITSWLAAGEPFELCAQTATLTLSNSGNLFLGGLSSFQLSNGQCAWFAYDDFRPKIDLIGAAITGVGAAVPSGPASTTANDVTTYADAAGTQQDSGVAITALCHTDGTHCPAASSIVIRTAVITSGICTTPGTSYGSCSFTPATLWSPAFADTGYSVTCTAATPTSKALNLYVGSKTTSTATITLQNGTSDGAVATTTAEIDCTAIHP